MADDLKPVLARQMEVYAGFLEHTDFHAGRLIDTLEDLGVLDDTLVYYIIGDNGASAEGTVHGTFNELLMLNGAADFETTESMASHIDEFGTPDAYNHYAVGWAHAMDTPYQWTKQVASHWGGTRNGTIVHWPNGFAAKGEVRSQFTHVIDVAPTDPRGGRDPGARLRQRHPAAAAARHEHGVLLRRRRTPRRRHDLQYFEMFCNRGIYHQGWTAVTRHSTPFVMGPELPAFDDDVWELYAPDDWTQSNNLAAENPAKLAELQRLFLIEGVKYDVFPLDDRRVERFNSDLAGRPTLVQGKTQLLFGGMGRLSENSVLNLKNKSHSVTAEIEVPEGGANGVVIAQGGAFAGWTVYLQDGKLTYCHNLLGLMRFKIGAESPVPGGTHQVRMEFAYDGGGLAKGGDVTLYVDGDKVGEGRVERHRADGVLGRRDLRRRLRHRLVGQRRLRARGQPLHRHGEVGPARHRRRRPRPPHHPRGAVAGRDVPPVTVPPADTAKPPGKRSLPIFQGLLPIDRSRVPTEIVAGVTLAALAIPEVMGYTTIAGMPVITGLYTILLPVLVFAVLGSSRHLVVGADSATAAVMAAGLAGLAASGSQRVRGARRRARLDGRRAS